LSPSLDGSASPRTAPASTLIQGCLFIACMQTPTGCGCAGFYCNGHFICGIRRPT